MSERFIHLHNHSHYSLLDGLSKVDDIVNRAKELGMDSISVTDHGNLYGAIEFYQKAKKAGIKPILGVEAYVAPGMRQEKGNGEMQGRLPYYHLILLAENKTGWQNLIKLVTRASLEGFYYKPRVDKELLREYHEGLIALSGCITGEIPRKILAGKPDDAEKTLYEYLDIFGKDNFFLEIGHHPSIKETIIVNEALITLSKKTGVPLCATQDSHYLKKEDAEYHDILLAVQTGNKLTDDDRLTLRDDDFSLRSPEEMSKLFKDLPQAIESTAKIADRCNVTLEFGKIRLPSYPLPAGKNAMDHLREITDERIKTRYPDGGSKEVHDRLQFELSVIDNMRFANYFLIVQDFINWAKNYGIVVGPGRGSAAGSLVSYVLGITDIDPLKYDLLFERFLNPERIEMPDIDIDFTDRRRDEVLNYVKQKYGEDKVAQIITFGTMAARAAVRDAGRALGMPYSLCDQIAKLIPFHFKFKDGLDKIEDLNRMYQTNPDAKRIIDAAKKLEGVARHASVHACGVVISKDPLTNLVPLQLSPQDQNSVITQFEMHAIQDMGLLKMDFLGLKNLTIIEDTLRLIKDLHGEVINISAIPLDDPKTYEFLRHGETTGVFQFECLSGESIISNTTIKKLYEKKHKNTLHSIYIDEGKVHKNKILDIVKSGAKDVYALIAENGWYVKTSENHNFFTEDGWKKLGELKPGDKILIKTKAKHLIYNVCATCGKQIDGQKNGQSKFCYSCSAKFYKNPSKPISREKISSARAKFLANGGRVWNIGLTTENNALWKATAVKISKALTGVSLEDRCGKEKALAIKERLSQRSKGSGNPMFGRPPPHRKGGVRADLGHYVRSNWEADFARVLKLQNIEYEYEPQTFRLARENGEILHYTPDFYVKSTNTFYEIKGWFHDLDKEKVALFQKQYPEFNFVLISKTKFAEFAIKYKSLVAWECPKIPNGFQFVPVKEIKHIGTEETYDIAMEAPGNNFVANGFVVHNSSGMRRYMKELKPTELEDLIALVALYRPGPMELIPSYIKRKFGEEKVTYLHSRLEPILKNTYGIGVYQEQMMRIARDLAGYTLAEADTLRKAIGKKIQSLLDAQKEKLIKGMIANGIEARTAAAIWELFPPFARYGFNRSHAACYALIGYQTAYLKAHYPVEFMASLLNADKDDTERISFLVSEAGKIGIKVLPPEINASFRDFMPDGQNIRFGLLAIKNVGSAIVDAITDERARGGSFRNFVDFLSRVKHKDLNKKSLESLLKCGVFDEMGMERNSGLKNIEEILKFTTGIRSSTQSASSSLFGDALPLPKLKLTQVEPAESKEKLTWEKELMGLYVSDHPLNQHKGKIAANKARTIKDMLLVKNSHIKFNVAGLIGAIKKINDKNGRPMLFAKLEDFNDEIEMVVFASVLAKDANVWKENNPVLVTGRVDVRNGDAKLICDSAIEL